MLKYLTKNYWWITILLIGLAILLDLNFDAVETIKTPHEIINSDGEKEMYTTLTLKNSYQLVRALIYVLYSLGVSLIVLVAIDKRIDTEENKRYKSELDKLNGKIQNNIFDGVLKKIVPEILFDQVKKDVLKTDIVRKNAKWNYQISHNDNKSFDLNQTIKYDIENLTEGEIKREIPVNINFSSSLSETKITHWKIKNSDGVIEREESQNFDKLIVELKSREIKTIELNILNQYKTESVVDSHVSSFSIIDLELQVQKPKDVKINIVPSFTTKLTRSEPNDTLITYDKIPCILLGQGISYVIEKE
jgi:hypothetical protein